MKTALFKLHLSVFLAGFTGLFGKWIQLPEIPLVWYRVLLTIATLYPILVLAGRKTPYTEKLPRKLLFAIGSLQTLHWVLFYASIKASTVSVALVCISLMGFFTALFSPPIMGAKYSPREFVYSGITIIGIALIFHFDTRYRLGIAIGVVSSAIAALFVILNKKYTTGLEPKHVFFNEMLGGFILLTLFLPMYHAFQAEPFVLPGVRDFFLLFILAFVLTVVLYIIQLQALRRVSAFTVNLSLNLEPIYTIILAALFLGEAKDFTPSFYLGLGLILLSVVLQTLHVLKTRNTRTFAPESQKTTDRSRHDVSAASARLHDSI